jgi:hypothetical protein
LRYVYDFHGNKNKNIFQDDNIRPDESIPNNNYRQNLNENINSNLVSGFTLSDVSIAYTYKTKKQSKG